MGARHPNFAKFLAAALRHAKNFLALSREYTGEVAYALPPECDWEAGQPPYSMFSEGKSRPVFHFITILSQSTRSEGAALLA